MLELLEKHPKAAEVVRNWFTDKMIESLKTDDVPEDFKEIIRQDVIDNERIDKILGSQPRALFDVFDEHEIYINIIRNNGKFMWGWSDNIEHTIKGEFIDIRKEAESFAIKAAFEILEQKLSTDEATVEV
jgi:hypothetical protein